MCLPLKDLDERTLSKGEHLGFEFQTVHNGMGFRCGYVKVLPGHPWFGKSDSYDDGLDISVHGGVTFSEYGTECPTHGPATEWWIGFDCHHSGDLVDMTLPNAKETDAIFAKYDYVVRDQAYVDAECRSLCEQAARALTIA